MSLKEKLSPRNAHAPLSTRLYRRKKCTPQVAVGGPEVHVCKHVNVTSTVRIRGIPSELIPYLKTAAAPPIDLDADCCSIRSGLLLLLLRVPS